MSWLKLRPFQLTKMQTFYTLPTQCARSHYDVLGLSSKATQAEIKSAYYKLSKIYHPDISQDNHEHLIKFRDITDAYEVLGNVGSRKLYDRGLAIGSTSAEVRQDYTQAWSPKSSGVKVPRPVDGQNIYDFDAWSKAHYARARERRVNAKAEYDRIILNRNEYNMRQRSDLVIFILTLMGMTSVALFMISMNEDNVIVHYEEEPLKNIPNDTTKIEL